LVRVAGQSDKCTGEDVRGDGEQAGADGWEASVRLSTGLHRHVHRVLSSHGVVVTKRRKDRTGTRPDMLHTDTVTHRVTHSRAHHPTATPRASPTTICYGDIDAMHMAPNATEPRGRGGMSADSGAA
jgi:hypothetical protein